MGSDAEGIRVRNVRKLKEKKILVERESEKDFQILTEKVVRDGKLRVDVPGRILPRMIVYDVDRKYKDQELVLKNLDFLNEESRNSIRVVQKAGPKTGDTVHFILEMSGQVRDALPAKGRVFLGWNSYRDWVNALRCYQCQGFGHLASKCVRESFCEPAFTEEELLSVCENINRRKAPGVDRIPGEDIRHLAQTRP